VPSGPIGARPAPEWGLAAHLDGVRQLIEPNPVAPAPAAVVAVGGDGGVGASLGARLAGASRRAQGLADVVADPEALARLNALCALPKAPTAGRRQPGRANGGGVRPAT
jgi:hypothetical protein